MITGSAHVPSPTFARPGGPWFCDTCEQPIERPEDGMVVWLTGGEPDRRSEWGLRVVHHLDRGPFRDAVRCYPPEIATTDPAAASVADDHLHYFLGADGLVRLLELAEAVPAAAVHRVVLRLHVPNYEAARPFFRAAIAANLVEPNGPDGYFTQEQLGEILRWARERDQ